MSLLNASNNLVYDLGPTDKVTGTWTTDGVVDPLFPLTNIDSVYPWKPVKFTTNPTWIECDHGSAKRMDISSLIHCGKFDGPVHIKRGAASNPSTMDVTFAGTGVTEDLMPTGPYADLTNASGYNGATGFRYTRYTFSNTALLSLGLVRQTSVLRQLVGGFRIGQEDTEGTPGASFRTYGSVNLGYPFGVRPRSISVVFEDISDATLAELRAWSRATGPFVECLLILYPSVNDAWWVTWGKDGDWTFKRVRGESLRLHTVPVTWTEVGRGLKP